MIIDRQHYMSLPNTKRGFRRIIVNGINYDWRYFSQSGNLFVDIRLAVKPRHKLIVDLDCEDPWLQMPENINTHHLQPRSAPITPKFVAVAIAKNLQLGWQPDRQKRFDVKYQGGNFLLVKSDR